MRFEGVIKTWNDERGFGFIEPTQGGQEVFVHVSFMAYALDKSAAARGGWRTPESTLHFLSLAGGWPGALLAQQLLRHKSTKARFRSAFWGTVAVNVLVFVWLCSPTGQGVWAAQDGLTTVALVA